MSPSIPPHAAPEVAPQGVGGMTPLLTGRQLEILSWVLEGKSAWEIGMILGISGRSVDGHLRRIYLRLDVRTRLQAVFRAQDLGLLVRRSAQPAAP